jgi:hypothetical protein
MTRCCIAKYLAVIGTLSILAGHAVADPWPNEALKFYQMPLNNGATPYLVPPPPTHPNTPGYGTVPSTARYPGHDELSTAVRTNPNAPYQGTYMADDFADYSNSPVTHVRWWGSYLGQQPTVGGVRRFLISFEHNVPESVSSTGQIIPSHPNFSHPDNLHQIVELVPGAAPPPPGTFTEKFVPTPPGLEPPREALFEYNAELNLGKWFNEKAAAPGENNVYWLKIVALVDFNPALPGIEWGWHNRDWSIPNALAAKPGDTPDGAERIVGGVPDGVGGLQPVWHFEDDAVTGGIAVGTDPSMPHMPLFVNQQGSAPQNYLPPWDGPTPIVQFSKDLAFELYTRVIPEPASAALLALGGMALLGLVRRR